MRYLPLATALVLAAILFPASSVLAADEQSGWRVLTGRAAAGFQVPSDVRPARTWRDPTSGLEHVRYQQHSASFGAPVEGGQLTVVRRGQRTVLVIGAHYPGVRATNRLTLTPAQAADLAASAGLASVSAERLGDVVLDRDAELLLDPRSGTLFYRVESTAPGVRTFHDIDAQTGAVLAEWDAIDRANGMGTGVKGDRKSLLGGSAGSSADDLTRSISGVWRMQSMDGRLRTFDAQDGGAYSTSMPVMTDNTKPPWANDNDWRANRQRAAVDAQYYASLSDAYFRDHFGFDVLDPPINPDIPLCAYGSIRSVVHFDPFGGGYDNAFWDGQFLVYGDGDGWTTWSYSASQDVVTHEFAHAVTECATNLAYVDETGALSESFSDIMATAAEWAIDEPVGTNCRHAVGQTGCPDWWIGEDVIFDDALGYAFRNMSDPALMNQPSHYADYYPDPHNLDNGGVHTNSGIPNHAFYLMVEGGRNARCSGPADPQADCDVVVPAIGMADAEQVAFEAWSVLPSDAQFCAARDATVAAADLLFPDSAVHHAAAELSWAAVGGADFAEGLCEAPPFSMSIPNRSLALAPGGAGQFSVAISGAAGPITYGTSDPTPFAAVANPDGTVDVSVPLGAPSGVYPLILSADDGSAVRHASAVVIVDAQAPSAEVGSIRIALPGTVTNTGLIPLLIGWSASDAESGIASAYLDMTTDGGGWTAISAPTSSGGTTAFGAPSGEHRWRVVAADAVGNALTSAEVTRTATPFQETAATYTGSWSTLAGQPWSATRYSKQAGAAATFVFSGSDVAWISTLGPKRGKARVYIDGTLIRTVDLFAASVGERRVVFTATDLAAGQHTLKIVVRGTTGRPRVDINGFAVLS